MPTHKMHMYIANEVNKSLKLDDDMVMIGSVLPDLTIDKRHRASHFKNGEEGVSGTANPYKFLLKYKKDLVNPVMVGYLIHLLTDRYFNSYVFQNYYIYDENTHLIGIKFHDEKVLLPIEKIRYEKHRDFFVYDKYLVENNKVKKFQSMKCVDSIKNNEDAKYDKDLIRKYIENANIDIDKAIKGEFYKQLDNGYKVMCLEELNKQSDLCVKQILKFFSGLKEEEWNGSALKNKIKATLKDMVDLEYRDFHSKLCPNVNNILGVRVSDLRMVAKNLLKDYSLDLLYSEIDNEYYEEVMLKAIIIGYENDIERVKCYISDFLFEVDNWAICDTFCAGLKITKRYLPEMRDFILGYRNSTKEYELRFMLVMILNYYMIEDYLDDNFEVFDSIKVNDYYVEMALAWVMSVSFIKFYDRTLEYFVNSSLSDFVYNKTISKVCDSYRVDVKYKEDLKSLKR